ncbi:MAG: hypothetical protein IJ131_05340 [Eggerthellaceae bacterium]|nr:hypothetical protein [Eggerthellaceae bacterium]
MVDGEFVPFDPDSFDYAESGEQAYDVYVDSDGNEFIIVDGQRVSLDSGEYEVVEVDPDDPNFNPLAYDNVQAATDVANDLARAGGSIVREGAELAGELKEAMDDISSMLDFKTWLK